MNASSQHQPHIFYIDTVTSVLDYVKTDNFAQQMQPFDSVLAKQQTQGRGQYHRYWVSPVGNIYAAMRLPKEAPFVGTQAAVALSAWLTEALNCAGYPAFLKWPNDIVVNINDQFHKVCGILLEERGNVLMAGIGINVATHPSREMMRENAALPAGNLADVAHLLGLNTPIPNTLWELLVKHVYSFYSYKIEPSCDWLDKANTRLLWRGQRVEVEDSGSLKIGVLEGIAPDGALILKTAPDTLLHFLSGSIKFCN